MRTVSVPRVRVWVYADGVVCVEDDRRPLDERPSVMLTGRQSMAAGREFGAALAKQLDAKLSICWAPFLPSIAGRL